MYITSLFPAYTFAPHVETAIKVGLKIFWIQTGWKTVANTFASGGVQIISLDFFFPWFSYLVWNDSKSISYFELVFWVFVCWFNTFFFLFFFLNTVKSCLKTNILPLKKTQTPQRYKLLFKNMLHFNGWSAWLIMKLKSWSWNTIRAMFRYK